MIVRQYVRLKNYKKQRQHATFRVSLLVTTQNVLPLRCKQNSKTTIMKKMLFTLLAAVGVTTASAQQYEIKGSAPRGVLKVYLRNFEGNQVDSTLVADGAFTFKGDADGKLYAQVSADNGRKLYVVLDGNVQVDLATEKATGTAENDSLTAWGARLATPMNSLQAIQQQAQNMRREGTATEEAMRDLSAKYDEAMAQVMGGLKQMCTENLQMKFPALYLGFYGTYLENDVLLDLSEKNPAFLQVSLLNRLNKAIKGWKSQKVGADVVDFAMADTTGTERHLTEFVGKGKYVLVDFWASWCGPCRQEMPNVVAAYNEFKAKGFGIVGVSLDNNLESWKKAIKDLNITWAQMSDLKGWQCEGAALYGVRAIPATVLVDQEGIIVARNLRGDELKAKLAELMK